VPVYLHDYFGAGRHALVVSKKSGEYLAEPQALRSESPLTGNGSQVKEVKEIGFPEPLSPVDDLPPTTVMTRVIRKGNQTIVRGIASDNGTIVKVTVNGLPAKATAANFSEWEITLDGATDLTAIGTDAVGNVEKTPMKLTLK